MTNLPARTQSREIQKRHLRRYDSGKVTLVNPKVTPTSHRPTITRLPQKQSLKPMKRDYHLTPNPEKLPPKDRTDSNYERYINASPSKILWLVKDNEDTPVRFYSCPVCGKMARNELIFQEKGILQGAPVSSTFCKDCWKKHLKEGVVVFSINSQNKQPVPGRLVVIKEEALKNMFPDMKITENRTIFMEDKLFDSIFEEYLQKESKKKKSIKELLKDIEENEKEIQRLTRDLNESLKDFK